MHRISAARLSITVCIVSHGFCQSFVVDEAVVMLGVVVLGVMGEAVVMLGVVEPGVLVVDKAILLGVV